MISRSFVLAIAAFGAACSAQISDGNGAQLAGIDAAPGGPGGDASTIDAAPACASRVVYLSFEGQALTQGPSDATLNQASWMLNPTGTAPRYRSGDAARDAQIKTIVEGVTAQLARFPITIKTARPAAGPYVMVVYGGAASAVGSRYGAAVNTLDCGDTRPSDLAWIADGVTGQRAINTTIGAIGFGLGLTATSDPSDCMCGWANQCQSNNAAACTLGAPIARDPGASQLCPAAGATQDEVAAVRAAFCS
jgi:hypothetical protein